MTSERSPRRSRRQHALQCMELWGGTGQVDHSASVPGVDVRVVSRPYADGRAGGDLHYVTTCGAMNITRFALADVSGHGESVAGFGSVLRTALRRSINTVDQSRIMRKLNREMLSDAGGGHFATAVLATYFAPTDHLIVSNAGHPPPLWYDAARGEWSALNEEAETADERAVGVRNLPLGVIGETGYTQFAVGLKKNDIVLMYTDSAVEARTPDGRMLGLEGLLELARTLDVSSPETIPEQLASGIAAFTNDAPQDDDATVMVLHHNAGSPGVRSVAETVRVVGRMLGLGRVETLRGTIPAAGS